MECRICLSVSLGRNRFGMCRFCTELVKVVAAAHFSEVIEPTVWYVRRLVKRLSKKRHMPRKRAASWLAAHLEYIGKRPPNSPK